jgi:hypothetical protein
MMQGLAFVGVIALATVLWAIASTMNARRARSLGPINREHFETAEPVDAAPTIPVRAAGEWLATGSHWGEGRNFGPTDGTVAEQMVERLAAGDLNAWGRQTRESPLVRLRPAAFATGLIDLPEDTLFIVDKDATYYDLQLDESEMRRTWPAGAP